LNIISESLINGSKSASELFGVMVIKVDQEILKNPVYV